METPVRQHLIDPEVCIRCATCARTCTRGAITNNGRNFAVTFEICEQCGDCLAVCPTGAIDSWRDVTPGNAYSVDEQLAWDTLPEA